ncbi:MAG TPA: NADP-dependent phosphogluconate dehydrogenase, partial [Myxococcota bacterium]|nr:NADP-dependent phosphogluconate dehydrogenase [Myxococcota bacterium]
VGLGVMGANLARNFASRGHAVALYNRTAEAARELARAHPESGFEVCETLEALRSALQRPRRIILMVPAGSAVDDVLDALDPLLERDDIVVDAGNSLFTDTDRRSERASHADWRFVGMGVSGGSEGALLGPSIMPGGEEAAWEELRPLLESIAAQSDSGACVTHCGRGSAGHFVKMVHNGIEYGDMQLIAESAMLLRRGLGLSPSAVADVFAEWNEGDLESYLIEITADIFRKRDPRDPDSLLLDAVLDRAGQKGTGRWTVKAALDLGVAVPTLAAAVDARVLSSDRERRVEAERAFRDGPPAGLERVDAEDVRAALYASKVASYTQGFDLLARASEAYEYGTDLAEVARIWKAGCIIRARFLDRVRVAFRKAGEAPPLALAPDFRDEIVRRLPRWRRVVAEAVRVGIPVPGLATSLSWFDTLSTARGSASLIQAQRDYFGSHTYERVDAPGVFVHSEWGEP